MQKEILFSKLSSAAWADFCKEWKSWVVLAIGTVLLQLFILAAIYQMPEYMLYILWGTALPMAMYTALLQQNGLDAVYGRKLTMFKVTPAIIFASLFFIALSLYHPFPEYSDYLLMVLPEDFKFLFALNLILHGIVSYLLMRCMFVGMVLLEEKCNVIQAFRKSFQLTAHHIFLLLGVFIYLAIVLFLSSFTIIGYFIVFPYTVLMKALLFKQLRQIMQ